MAKFKLLDFGRKDKKKTIYLFVYYQGNKHPFKYNTEKFIDPKRWDKSKERAKVALDFKEGLKMNEYLNKIESDINYIIQGLTHKVTNSELKRMLQNKQEDRDIQDLDFFQFAYENNERLKPNTRRLWNSTVKIVGDFQTVYGAVNFHSFDMQFYNKFKEYCMKELNYADSTFSTRIGHIKRILKNAESNNITVNQGYKNSDFKKIGYESNAVYLSEEELKKILKFDFSRTPELEYIRDIFVIRCYIGTRFSDSVIKRSNIINVENNILLKVFTSKSKKDVYIPIHPIVKELMDKYDWKLKSYSNEYVNRSIKDVCRICGITEKVSFAEKRGGKTRMLEKEKWELISTHTARRSVATNMFLRGIDPILILPITGHSTVEQLKVYIKADNLQKALMVAKSDFFKGE